MAVARVTEIIASSKEGWDDAARQAIARAARTLRGITGIEILRQNAKVENGRISEYRVNCRITFVLEK
ncbi:MAG: dodecin domain-containing protein [Deltaproteobacteria bacterium]|nr:dodecin domain-containing protein [Deltaproteobacteria bacterium]